MTGVDAVIEQAARLIDPDSWRLHDTGTFPPEHPAAQAVVRRSMIQSRRLHDAGLLAPGLLTEEWAVQMGADGPLELLESRDKGEEFAHDDETIMHCYVSEWLPADRAEGDGRADT